MSYGVRLCNFTSALGDVSFKERTQPHRILSVLSRNPRFSVFDVNHDSLAKTLDYLKDAGLMVYKRCGHYPWCEVEITPKGRRFLGDREARDSRTSIGASVAGDNAQTGSTEEYGPDECPYPISGDKTATECIANGHCGCAKRSGKER